MMSIAPAQAPDRGEAGEYYFTYINQVGAGDIREILATQAAETLRALAYISAGHVAHHVRILRERYL